ncbi:hypothetical protein [Allocoleopsis franciscana]|uniref:hypothetical protein n=1 Tax=Allocoleopsis franciscana TaxID=2886352 RepID=UPI0002D2B882|nr:hypothetical protein [Allocoleopsis franciscana]
MFPVSLLSSSVKCWHHNSTRYNGMNITSVTGLTETETATLKALGAVEDGVL